MEAVPSKIVLERRADGNEAAWIESVLASARSTGALDGSSVFAHDDERFVLLRFHSEQDLVTWRSAAEANGLFSTADIATHPHQVRTGLETWFTLPGHPAPRMPPPRWKMAVVTWIALMPTVFVVGRLFGPLVPHELAQPLVTAITVSILTWLLMPNLVRLLHRWLY